MSYKAINNQGNYCSRPQTMSETVHNSNSWECRTISSVSKILITTVLLVMITGLFADPLTLPNIRGSISLSYNPVDVVYTSVKLFDASNNQINQVYPNPDGSFVFSTIAGQYYLKIEMSRPDLGKFSYPIQTQDIYIPNTSYCENLGAIQVERYSMSSVKVSSDPAHPYFKSIDQAIAKIFSAVNNGYNGDSVTLYLFPDEYQLVESQMLV